MRYRWQLILIARLRGLSLDIYLRIHGYGTNHFFAVLDETLLQELIELKDMKLTIWEYNGKLYLKINAVKVKEAQVETGFKKRSTIHQGFNIYKIRF